LKRSTRSTYAKIWASAKQANGAPPERHGVAFKIAEILQAKFGEGKGETLL
jgi:hypothetical protein